MSKKDETISNAFQLNISNEIPIIEVKQILSKKVNIGWIPSIKEIFPFVWIVEISLLLSCCKGS